MSVVSPGAFGVCGVPRPGAFGVLGVPWCLLCLWCPQVPMVSVVSPGAYCVCGVPRYLWCVWCPQVASPQYHPSSGLLAVACLLNV